jgi:hypothetical protein
MPNLQHPAKLLVLDPVRTVKGYRRNLSALEATLMVELTPDQRFTFALRETRKLGPRSYARCLIDLAADLAAGYTIALAKPGVFLDELVDLARTHATAAQRDAVEAAALSIAERSHHQVRDVMDGDIHHTIGRSLILAREPTRGRRRHDNVRDSFNSIGGVPTPRTEQLWNSLRSEWCDVRTAQHAQAAWEEWAKRGRRSTILSSRL